MSRFGHAVLRFLVFAKALPPGAMYSVPSRGGWWPVVREGFAGAWQRNIEYSREDILTYAAVYRCVTLIASDVGKVRIKLVEKDSNGIWNETENPAYSPVLRKPNRYQTHIKFKEQWIVSKLLHGNTYVLKARDNRGVVTAMYVLDATRVKPLVAPDGSVYYALNSDNLTGLKQAVTVPASEIIHDVMVPLYHPLCGVSPLTACGLAASLGLRVQNNSARFFANGSQPSGILTTPDDINDEQAKEIQKNWNEQFSGDNQGKVAALGNDMKYQQMSMSAVDSELIKQLKWTAEMICTAFGVPGFMIGIGDAQASTVEARTIQYYTQCLQILFECMEALLDEGLGMVKQTEIQRIGTELDLDQLLRMDTPTRVKAGQDAIASGGMSPNEARMRFFDLGPVKGGNSPMMQQQQWSLEDLSKRRELGEVPKPSTELTPLDQPETPKALPSAPDQSNVAALFGTLLRLKSVEAGLIIPKAA